MRRVLVGREELSIEDIVLVSRGEAQVELSKDPEWRELIRSGAEFVEAEWQKSGEIYGVTTGYGASCDVGVRSELVEALPAQLVRFHGCGLGRVLDEQSARAVMLVRLLSLTKGYSGVRFSLIELISQLLNESIIPVIPEEGSVGASGDLTPLSYLAAVLSGDREVYYQGERVPTEVAFSKAGISPLELRPKEALALMNGTAAMTGLAVLAFSRAEYLAKLASRITSLAIETLGGSAAHFNEKLHAAKPHPGQRQVAAWIREDISRKERRPFNTRLQERYSIRCAPHVIGVLVDALAWMRSVILIEVHSANDNPLVDLEREEVLHGGHFYGGHIAFVMDGLKNAVANVADLLDRQLALLVDPNFNNGLPANLSGASKERACINHGLKAVQIASSAWTAEALKLTMPASVFSRSTECHNQDKVSMGTIAARDCLRVLELSEQVAAALLIATRQGIALRIKQNEADEGELREGVLRTYSSLAQEISFIDEDRPLEGELRKLLEEIRSEFWELY